MPARLAADLVVVVHAAFVLYVVFGGLLALRWPKAAWVHLPAAAWGAAIEFTGWICPLTPLENALRQRAGDEAYAGDFVARYLLAALYPEGLTRGVQLTLGAVVVLINVAIYAFVVRRARARAAAA